MSDCWDCGELDHHPAPCLEEMKAVRQIEVELEPRSSWPNGRSAKKTYGDGIIDAAYAVEIHRSSNPINGDASNCTIDRIEHALLRLHQRAAREGIKRAMFDRSKQADATAESLRRLNEPNEANS